MTKKICLLALAALLLTGMWGCAKKKIDSEAQESAQEKSYYLNQKAMQEGAEASTEDEKKRLSEKELAAEKEEEARLQADAEKAKKEAVEEIVDKKIHFAFDSYELSSEAREILQEKAELLKKYSELEMVIEGYCDERGTEEYNLALGEKRARAAYEFLVLLGVDSERIQIVSYGEEYPVDPGHNEEAWAKNRRDEFRIVE
ncbi:MAG: peptidoglycan-associated lipoprotein Pal [Desulfonatronovibrionaceae bacterium]